MVFSASIDCIHSYTFRNTIRSYWPPSVRKRIDPFQFVSSASSALLSAATPTVAAFGMPFPRTKSHRCLVRGNGRMRESRKERSSRHRFSKSSSLLASQSRSSSTASQSNVLLLPSSPSHMLSEQFLTTGYEYSCWIARTFMRLHIQADRQRYQVQDNCSRSHALANGCRHIRCVDSSQPCGCMSLSRSRMCKGLGLGRVMHRRKEERRMREGAKMASTPQLTPIGRHCRQKHCNPSMILFVPSPRN